jgi:molecular chaperone HtpG
MELPIFLNNIDINKEGLFKMLSNSKEDYLHKIDVNINNEKFKATGTLFISKDISSLGKCELYLNDMLIEGRVSMLPEFFSFLFGIIKVNEIYDEELIFDNLTNFILEYLNNLQINEKEQYSEIYIRYRSFIKDAILDSSNCNYRDKLIELLEFDSNRGDTMSFNSYLNNLQEDQKDIFYLSGERLEELYNSPYLERVNDNEICVLLLLDMVDEYLLKKIGIYKNKVFMDITREDLEIIIDDEQSINDFSEIEKFYSNIKTDIHKLLDNSIEEVRLSLRLTDSPCVLLTKKNGISPNMERIMRVKHSFDDCCGKIEKRVLEINPNHILIHALYELHSESIEAFNNMAKLIYQTTLIRCGVPVYRPIEFTNTVHGLIGFCLDIKEEFAKDPDEIELQLPSSKETENSDSGGGVGEDLSSSS